MKTLIAMLIAAGTCGVLAGCSNDTSSHPQRPMNPNYDSPGKANPTDSPAPGAMPSVRPLGAE